MNLVHAGISHAAVGSFGLYQRWISPYKGFRCAHHVLHGKGGCSSYGSRAFSRYPALFAWRLLRRRFVECREAYVVLLSKAEEKEKRKRRKDSTSSSAGWCPDVDPCTAYMCSDALGSTADCAAIGECAACA